MSILPTIFLSSTFYDLQQVRKDIVDFVQEEMGYRCLASEMNSFPTDPDADTAENCRRRVEQEADVLVLVIGGRYGAIPKDREKSVTNLEYLIARAKGIPIFAFVKSEVLAVLSTWKANPGADFKSVVDDPRVFEFISLVRETHSVWTHQFTVAQDITDCLREQFAYQMLRGLNLQRQLRGAPGEYAALSGRSLQIALEQSPGWNGLLLAQLIEDEIASSADLRFAYDGSVSFGPGERVGNGDFREWWLSVLHQAERLITGLNRVLTEALAQALNAGDSRRIASCVRFVGRAYREAMEWAVDVRRAHVHPDCRELVDAMALFTRNIVEEIEGLPERIRRIVEQANASGARVGEALEFHFSLYNQEEYDRAHQALRRRRPDLIG